MLYLLLYPLADDFHAFNLFRYITFRSGGAVVTALLISFVFGPPIIAWLKSKQGDGQPIRNDGPASHIVTQKGHADDGRVADPAGGDGLDPAVGRSAATPMSGSCWRDASGSALIGFFDDYRKLTRRSHRGAAGPRLKLAARESRSPSPPASRWRSTSVSRSPTRSRCRFSRTCCSTSAGSSCRSARS